MSDRNVLVDLQQAVGSNDWANVDIYFQLLTEIAIIANEVYPQYTGKVTTDNDGLATAVIATPDTGAWQYQCTITGVMTFIFNLEAGGDIYLSAIVADNNLDASTDPGDIQAAIDAHVALPDPHTQYYMNGDVINLFFDVRNNTASTITRGTPVMAAGTLGSSGRVLIQPAIADGTLPPYLTMGVVYEDIAKNANGQVLWFGLLEDYNTTGSQYGESWSDASLIYTSASTDGYATSVSPPAPNRKIQLAIVIYAHANSGILLVRPSWHPRFTELDDVSGVPSATEGLVAWNETSNVFEFTNQPSGFFMQREIIITGEAVTIPSDHQMVVFGGLAIEPGGYLDVEGSGGLVTPA